LFEGEEEEEVMMMFIIVFGRRLKMLL
jgi:hypothetical protein